MPATEDYLRPLPKMHRWFAVSMIVLFLATLLMMYFDHHDEWRVYQHHFFKLQAEKIVAEENAKKAQLAGAPAGLKSAKLESAYETKLTELKDAKTQKQSQLEQAVQDLAEQEANIKNLDNEYLMQMRKVRENRAYRDVARANFDLGIRDQVPENKVQDLLAEFNSRLNVVLDLETELDERDAVRNKAVAELKAKTKERDLAVAAIKAYEADILRLETAKDKIDPPWDHFAKHIKRAIMEWPIIDGFNSHIKIKQDWLPDMKITLGMAKTARFDRCRTCHLAIDMVGPGDVPDYPHGDGKNGTYKHPFSTHPHPDLYVTAGSPHPLNEFGCTSCHDGQGSGTSFQNASHTPNDPHQAHEWEHEFKWFNNHFWEYPMQPNRLRESACLKCHHSVVELGQNTKFGATAPKAYQGWQLIKKYGCFGCHEINGYDAGKPVGPDLRLEPQTLAEAKKIAEDPKAVAGVERKVGPSLKHIASKTTREWLTHWTEEPKRFRPSTIMPQFFHLSNNVDDDGKKFSNIELAAIAEYLFDNSKELKYDPLPAGYVPDAKRGETFFAQKGCLACHSHDSERFKSSKAEFGPNLSKVAAKLKPGPDGLSWLYTWIRDPERHHPRTKMPNLFIEPTKQNDVLIDPAADIAAYLLEGKTEEYKSIEVSDDELNELVEMLLWRRKTVTPAQAKQVMSSRKYPYARETVKGDEIELVPEQGGVGFTDEEWRKRKMNYLGRVTISRYGCYGCHDIANFETARPIGTALQDWGLKDPSRLAPEHIEEYLHHHGEPDGTSTKTRVERAIQNATTGDYDSREHEEQELGAAFFYESLLHHGRPGFIWQKLRDPRSYDYEKTETKFYDERLRMPKFPLKEQEIEAISTFVLGLVARPPAEKYQYRPKGAELAKVEGEKLLQKFNCTGCHLIDLPEITFGAPLKDYTSGFADGLVVPKAESVQPKTPEEEKEAVTQRNKEQIQRLVAFFQRVTAFADEVKERKQNVFVQGVGFTVPVLIDDEDLSPNGKGSGAWVGSIERLRRLQNDLKKLPDQTKFTRVGEPSFAPLASQEQIGDQAPAESRFSKRYKALLSPEQLDPKAEGFENKVQPIQELADVLAGTLDQFVLSDWSPTDHLAALDPLFSIKPVRSGLTGATLTIQRGEEKESLSVVTFKGLINSRPDPTADIEERDYGYKLWSPLNVAQRIKLPGSTMSFNETQLVSMKPSRGGAFAEWLSDDLLRTKQEESRDRAWQDAPPPLYLEGIKVQTPWLFSFLKNPYQVRHTTVLRMPRFNMTDAEAQTLANYFAAYDGAPFPYQEIPQRQPAYISEMNTMYHDKYPDNKGTYLQESWRAAGVRLCAGCHEFGGRDYKSLDPKKDIRGPNLEHVQNRLRPDWVTLWLLKPSFLTPHTSMPVNFPPNQKQFETILGGNATDQTIAVRDALLNYARLMEREGKLPEAQAAAPAADAKPDAAKSGDGGAQ